MFKKYLAEFFGTFLIVLFGCGAIVINQTYNGVVTHFGVSLTFGAIVCIAIYLFKKQSTHFNPAVSIALFANKQLSLKHLLYYIFFQVLGGIFAAFILKLFVHQNSLLGSTMPSGRWWQSFVLEFILTFLLLALIFMLDKKPTKYVGIYVGALIFFEAYLAGPICGASMNPARSVAPALVSGHLEYLWIYIFAPIAGGLVALLFFKSIRINRLGKSGN